MVEEVPASACEFGGILAPSGRSPLSGNPQITRDEVHIHSSNGNVRFGSFEVDLRAGELRKSGLKIKLQGQPLELLAMLLERPGEVLTREELQQKLWPANTFVDFEHGLNKAVNKLREALGDNADNVRFIETLPRRGYRFVAPVMLPNHNGTSSVEPSGEEEIATPAVPAQGMHVRTRRFAAVGLVCLAFAVVSLIMWLKRPLLPKIVRYTQITSDARLKGQLVTDGARIYFDEDVGGNSVLHEVSAEGGEAVVIPTSFKDTWLMDISRDGSKLLVTDAFPWSDEPLWALTLPGGFPHRVGDAVTGGATWSPDGQRIAYLRGNDIYVVRSDGSDTRKLVSLSGDVWHLRWSPDGKVLRFGLADSAKNNSVSLWEVSADGSHLHPLLPGWKHASAERRGDWTADGKYFFFVSSQKRPAGHSHVLGDIWVLRERAGIFEKASHSPVQLTGGPMEFAEVVPGKDGKRVFVLGERERGELVHYDSRSGQFVSYLSGISAEAVDFSRDAQWATYVAYPEGALWRSRVDGSERLQLTTSPMQIAAPRWSPDGKRIVFMGQLPDKPWKIYLISANGGNPQQLIPGESGEETPSWSTDGNSIAYGRLPDSSNPGDVRIGLLDLSTQQVSLLPGSEGLGSPKWSPDGRYLACQQFDWLFTGSSEKLMLFDFAARKWAGLADVRTEWPTWSRDGKYLYFVIRSAGDTAEFRVRVSDHKLERIVDLKDLHQAWGPFGPWSGLAPDDSPLAMRDVGTQDIYALDLQLP